MARLHPDIASSYFDSEVPEGMSLKEMPNYDRFQVEHMKLNKIDENCKFNFSLILFRPTLC
jgi:hypothetical protein